MLDFCFKSDSIFSIFCVYDEFGKSSCLYDEICLLYLDIFLFITFESFLHHVYNLLYSIEKLFHHILKVFEFVLKVNQKDQL